MRIDMNDYHAVMITPLYAALLSVLLAVLILRVVRLRWKLRIGIGDGGNPELQRAIRVHGNFIETSCWGLILLLIMETSRALPPAGLHIFGTALFLSRLLHAWGLTHHGGTSFGRMTGMIITVTLFLTGAAVCLWQYFSV